MKRFKYFICERDLICIAHGDMHRVTWYVKKPKVCQDSYCDVNSIVEVMVSISHPVIDGKNKGTKSKLEGVLKKRQAPRKKVSKLPRSSNTRR